MRTRTRRVARRTAALIAAGGLVATGIGLPTAASADEPAPLLHYPLDESEGAVAHDVSGNGLDGEIRGGADHLGAEGIRLDGVDDDVKLPDDIMAGLDEITVSMDVLVAPEQRTPYFLLGLGNPVSGSAGDGYLFLTGDAFRGALTLGNWSGEQNVTTGESLERGVWKTVTYTVDGAAGASRLFLDGDLVAENLETTIAPGEIGAGSTTSNHIGRSNYGSDALLEGQVRDFRIYDTALSAEQVADFGPSDAERVESDAAALTLGDTSSVTDDLALPAEGDSGTTIEWSSSDADVVADDGSVTRPDAGDGDATVDLMASVSRGEASVERTFEVTVLDELTRQEEVDRAADELEVVNADDVRGNVTLPRTVDGAPKQLNVRWNSSVPKVISPNGDVTRPDTDTTVELTAKLTYRGAHATRTFTANVREAADIGEYEGYMFSYFENNSVAGENIFFAASEGNDALNWQELNEGEAVLSSDEGEKGLRDPFLIRSPEGDTFYLIATDLSIGRNGDWDRAQRQGSQHIEVWESTDLVNWSEQRHVKVAPDNAGNTWAPEAYYDDEIGAYVVFWASKLYAEDDPDHTGSSHNRMMYATTRDFVNFTDPVVWQDPGMSRIDTTVLKEGDTYYRFTKDEGAGGTGCSDIIQESSTSLRALDDAWEMQASCIGRDAGTSAVEGPTIFKANPDDVNGEKFYLFVDEYGGRSYIPLETDDLDAPDWQVSAEYDLPGAPRHGTVMPVTADEHQRLLERWGE
ncbi:immunoglobulin-like domain-containing protein [Microbacterium sp. G2-8]|uniref:immunoglobulin-like domain-containing protein n=1 Tax=Microbacterium sp. G2-8 TaxID=2842454 RepID=UPI001C899281|nr:immunoglobulin-like domain-containing protein [Microbacterium sp. G2-8]